MKIARPRSREGFTLVEVMIAMAIIAITAVVLLDQRIEVVRDAARARDLRTIWVLAAQKMAELELDRTLWAGLPGQSNGDFSELDPSYSAYQWEYQIVREPIDVTDPNDPARREEKPREILRLTLAVHAPGMEEPAVLEAEFPIDDPSQKPPQPPASGDPSRPAVSSDPAAPEPGGIRR